MQHYFHEPTQLKYWDINCGRYVGGIGYRSKIICGCCGRIIDPEEVIKFAPFEIEPIVVLDWIDIENEIKGN